MGSQKYGATLVAPYYLNGVVNIKLRLYRVSEQYIVFLHSIDNRVQLNKGERRPYVGVVLSVNGIDYFVPMESPKPNHKNVKSGIHLMRIDEGKYGLLGFNNMIPVRREALIRFDIGDEPDEQYRQLLWNQIAWCNDHKDIICSHAEKTYNMVLSGKSMFHLQICCDFKKLEKASKRFDPNYRRRK